jgi:hypothetical protein
LRTFPPRRSHVDSRSSHISSNCRMPMQICTQSRLMRRLRSGYPWGACCLLAPYLHLLETRSSTNVNKIAAGGSRSHTNKELIIERLYRTGGIQPTSLAVACQFCVTRHDLFCEKRFSAMPQPISFQFTPLGSMFIPVIR